MSKIYLSVFAATALASLPLFGGNIQIVQSSKMSAACEPLKASFLKDNRWTDESDIVCDFNKALLKQATRFDLKPGAKISKADVETIGKAFLKANAAALGITAAQIADFYFDTILSKTETLAKTFLATNKFHFYPGFEAVKGGIFSPRLELSIVEGGVVQVVNDTSLLLPAGVTISPKPAITLTATHLAQVKDRELKLLTDKGVEKVLGKASTNLFQGKPELELFVQDLRGDTWVGLVWTQRLFVGSGDIGSEFFARFSAEDGSLVSLGDAGPR